MGFGVAAFATKWLPSRTDCELAVCAVRYEPVSGSSTGINRANLKIWAFFVSWRMI
jgi:hypothetical protein